MTDKKVTRGRRSKIDLLPPPIRKKLDRGLRDGSISQTALLNEVNELIESAGLSGALKLSKTGLNRYASKMEAVGKSLREVREVTRVWAAELGDKPTSHITNIILEMAREKLYRALLNQDEETTDIGMLKDLMLTVNRLESAAEKSHKREKELRKVFAEEAANAAEKVAAQAGLTVAAVELIKKEILGIA